jgi:drug/metabolite transporter (DMT)-like permease
MTVPRNRRTHRPLLPYLALTFGLLGLGFTAILVKWANAPGAVNGFYRMAIAATALAAPCLIKARRSAPLSRRHLRFAALAGFFFASDLVCWNTALLITSAANATLLGNTSPLWVGLGAWLLFRQRLRPAFWVGLGVAMGGAAIVLGADLLVHPRLGVGDGLSLLSGLFYGFFFLATERARDRLPSLVSWWVSAMVSAAVLLVYAVVLRQPLTGYSTATYVDFAALALLAQVGAYLSISYALGHLPASIVAPTLLGQPVLTAILAVPLLGQALSAPQIGGGVIVLAGVWLVHRGGGEERLVRRAGSGG